MSSFLSFKKNLLIAVRDSIEIPDHEKQELIEIISEADAHDLVSLVNTGYTKSEMRGLQEKYTDAFRPSKWKRDYKNIKAGLSFAKGKGRTAGERKVGEEKVKQAMKSLRKKKATLAGTAIAGAAALGAAGYAAHKIAKKRREKKEKRELEAWKKRQGISDSFIHKYIRKTFSELIGTRYIPYKPRGDEENTGDEDEAVDFPYVEDPEPFITHRPIESVTREQGEEMAPPPEEGEMPPEEGMPPEGMGAGLPGEEVQTLNVDEIGRVYELKKIYSRMTSIETYLSGTSDQNLLELRRYVAKAIDLFEVVITNFQQFKPKIDEIIVTYYNFVSKIYEMVKNYYKDVAEE